MFLVSKLYPISTVISISSPEIGRYLLSSTIFITDLVLSSLRSSRTSTRLFAFMINPAPVYGQG